MHILSKVFLFGAPFFSTHFIILFFFLWKRFWILKTILGACTTVYLKLAINSSSFLLYRMLIFWKIFMIGFLQLLMTIPKNTISEPYKLLRIVITFIVRQIALSQMWSVFDVFLNKGMSSSMIFSAMVNLPKTAGIICPNWHTYKLIHRS